MIYNEKIKKMLPKKPANAFCQFLKEKKGQKLPNGTNQISYWREIYEKLTKGEKKKYEEKAEKEAAKYRKKMELFEGIIFDIPKKPLSAFSLYLKDNIAYLRQKYQGMEKKEIFKKASDDWQNEDPSTQKKYVRIAESDRKIFQEEFEKLGYYKKRRITFQYF